jgi:SAM-dependent methyltransferase
LAWIDVGSARYTPPVTDPNREQRESWNGSSGERWGAAWEQIDHQLEPIARAVIAFAAARPGERVLDVGCGHGTTALILREQVGPSGAVTGLDLSAPLLAIARDRARRAGADIRFVEADAQTWTPEPGYDLVFSRFGVMFFADPVAAFANLRRTLVPSGRVAFVCWRELATNPWVGVPAAAARDLVPPQPPVDPDAPGMFGLADAGRTREILSAAGFTEIRIEPYDDMMWHGATADEAAVSTLTVGPLSRQAADVDDSTRAQIRARVAAALERFATARGIEIPMAVWLVGARPR